MNRDQKRNDVKITLDNLYKQYVEKYGDDPVFIGYMMKASKQSRPMVKAVLLEINPAIKFAIGGTARWYGSKHKMLDILPALVKAAGRYGKPKPADIANKSGVEQQVVYLHWTKWLEEAIEKEYALQFPPKRPENSGSPKMSETNGALDNEAEEYDVSKDDARIARILSYMTEHNNFFILRTFNAICAYDAYDNIEDYIDKLVKRYGDSHKLLSHIGFASGMSVETTVYKLHSHMLSELRTIIEYLELQNERSIESLTL